MLPGCEPVVFRVALAPLPEIVPLLALQFATLTGTLSGLVHEALSETLPPVWVEVGFADSDKVGGFLGGSFTMNFAEQLVSPPFFILGSVILAVAVYSPPATPFVSIEAVFSLPVILPPVLDQSKASVCFGLALLTVAVTVIGSPTMTSAGCTEQDALSGSGGLPPPYANTNPVRRRAPLRFGCRRSVFDTGTSKA